MRAANRWVGDHAVILAAALALGYMFLPVVVVFLLSFNDPAGRFNYTWNRFTFDNWTSVCSVSGLCDSVVLSLQIALLSTLAATLLGTLIAFAIARPRFRGRATTNLLIFLPMATPEVVMGASLLALFVNAGGIALGFWTILIAHIMFCISFVVVTVKARLSGLDPALEKAAMDLYANELQTFRKVTLRLAMPGIVAAALLAFALSFDDFIITNFNSGNTDTFPKFVYVSATRGIPAQANVIGSAMFLIALAVVVLLRFAGARRHRP